MSTREDGSVILYALNTSDLSYKRILAHHNGTCYKIVTHHEEPNMILSCGEDGIVKNIDIREAIGENEKAKK